MRSYLTIQPGDDMIAIAIFLINRQAYWANLEPEIVDFDSIEIDVQTEAACWK